MPFLLQKASLTDIKSETELEDNQNEYRGGTNSEKVCPDVEGSPALVDARVLTPPILLYHQTGREYSVEPRIGQWNKTNKKMINGGNDQYWSCLKPTNEEQWITYLEDLVTKTDQ
ncbi:hypothetical protein Fmac_028481 [Flemingia macrophylla]|uniref:Uncharacterized protein n=1 Tax=Flemingia macrophylla TaxID=520843 RepID=A0ABD1L7L8_9FABA